MGMIGSHYWRNKRHGLNKCDEGGREHCSDHADCCAVTACTYCFELEIYGEEVQKVSSNRTDNHWTGTVGNVSFDMYWARDYDTDECVLIVEANGEEVYRKSCYEGQSCRDSSDETAITVDYEDAILRWIKHESRPLPHRIDPDTGCKVWFCGECECSCRELCVTVTDPEGATTKGELSDVSYDDCEGPVWSGTVGEYELELALSWDIYDQCVLLVKVDGEEQDAVAVTGCKDLSATIELYDGTTIEVACKICACEVDTSCCGLRGVDSLTLVYTGISTGWGPGETVGVRYTIWTVTLTASASWYRSDVPNPYDPTDLYVVYMEDGGSNDLECVGLTSASWWGGGFSRFFPVGTGMNEWTCPGNFGLIKPYSLTPPNTGFDGYYTDIEITIA